MNLVIYQKVSNIQSCLQISKSNTKMLYRNVCLKNHKKDLSSQNFMHYYMKPNNLNNNFYNRKNGLQLKQRLKKKLKVIIVKTLTIDLGNRSIYIKYYKLVKGRLIQRDADLSF